MALKQTTRLLNLNGPFPENELVLLSFSGYEGLSQLFRFELEMVSDSADIKPKDIVGKDVTFSVRLADDSMRHFHGFVSRFVAGDEDENGRRNYRAEVVPWFWFLTRHSDCRIFEDSTVKDILEKIFEDRGFTDHKIKLSGTHPKRQYCVQFRETDYDFCCRLMEEEGIWFTFVHEDGKHTMLISDSKNDYFDCAQKEVDYPTDFGSLAMEDHIRSWTHNYEFRSGKIAQSDYNIQNEGGDNFLMPSSPMDTDSTTVVDLSGPDKYELYDYPGIYSVKSEGTKFADVRMEAEEVDHNVVEGTSICRAFTPGGKFKVRQHRSQSEEGSQCVVVSLSHEAHETEGYETGEAVGEGYNNSFTCIPADINFRPPRQTPKPSVRGVQTAIVIGDDEIPVDKYGRVRVRFPWDRAGKKEDKGSCWVRVSQLWASAEWGGMHIPHKDDEVLVDFIDGDPDRPVIVGRVYNDERKVPLPLPDEKTKCIIRDYGNNQMIWEGKPGEQYIQINQECGNGLVMNGKPGEESIQLRDMFGNQIYMGAASKTISIVSPSHESGMILGKSKHTFTGSDVFEIAGGCSLGAFVGNKFLADAGSKASATFGVASDLTVGHKCTAGFGHTVEYAKGKKITIGSQSGYSKMSEFSHAAAKKDCILDADEKVWLLGGKKDNAVLEASKDKLRLTFKTDSKDRKSVSDPGWKGVLPTILAQSAHVVSAAGNYISDVTDFPGEPIKADGEYDDEDYFLSVAESGAHALLGASAAVVVALNVRSLANKLTAESEANKAGIASHESPDAQLLLMDGGAAMTAENVSLQCALRKSYGVHIKAKGEKGKKIGLEAADEIIMTSGKGIMLSTPKTEWKKGTIKHKNFLVLT